LIVKTCWEIRQELLATTTGAAPSRRDALIGWNLACSECTVPLDGRACWEQCGGSPCCCAPVHVTCDFCEIYLEHRRELAGMTREATAVARAASLQPESKPQPQGGTPIMEKVQFNVPNLWADHHILKVRDVLTQLPGVADVVASSAFRMVAISYDPAVTGPEAITQALTAAGYPVAEEGQGVRGVLAGTQPVPMQDGRRDPAWNRLGMRQFKTDERDLKTKR
jgi:copper chaperone CopZ